MREPKVQGPLPGPRARAFVERDARTASPSLIKDYPLVVARGEGCWWRTSTATGSSTSWRASP